MCVFILQAHYALGLQSELSTAHINCTYILGGQWKTEPDTKQQTYLSSHNICSNLMHIKAGAGNV